MEETSPKVGPNEADSPAPAPENAQVFGYNVATNSKTVTPSSPNPASPLAAG